MNNEKDASVMQWVLSNICPSGLLHVTNLSSFAGKRQVMIVHQSVRFRCIQNFLFKNKLMGDKALIAT